MSNAGQRAKPLLTAEVRAWYRSIGGGWKDWNSAQRSLNSRLVASKGWNTRRLRYGPSGRKPNDYAKWRADRGYPPIGPEGENAPKH